MEKYSSPEERLLKLIRNKDKNANLPKVAKSLPSSQKAALKTSAKEAKLLFLIKRLTQKIFSLNNINIVLVSVVVFCLGYIIFEFIFLKEKNKLGQLTNTVSIGLKTEEKKSDLPQPVSFDYYAEKLNKRDIFKPVFDQGSGETASEKSNLQETAANLRLAGIIVDKQPQAIIEDIKLKKTYFLYKGDYLGEIKVEDILESKVILSYNDEKLELVP